MALNITTLRTEYLTAASVADRKQLVLDLVNKLEREPLVSFEQATLLLYMSADIASERGKLEPDLEAALRQLFLTTSLDDRGITAFRDELFAKHVENLTAAELASAFETLGGNKGEIDAAKVQKLFALAASQGEITADERGGLRRIRLEGKLTAEAKEQYAAQMLAALLETIGKSDKAPKLSDEMALDLVTSAAEHKERAKYIGAIDDAFLRAKMSDEAVEAFRTVFKDAPELSALELALAKKSLSGDKGELSANALRKLLVRISADDNLSAAEEALVRDLEQTPMSAEAKKVFEEWRQLGAPGTKEKLNDAIRKEGTRLFGDTGKLGLLALASDLGQPRQLKALEESVAMMRELASRLELNLPLPETWAKAACDSLRQALTAAEPATRDLLAFTVLKAITGNTSDAAAFGRACEAGLPMKAVAAVAKDLPFPPSFADMNDTHLCFAGRDRAGVWQIRLLDRKSAAQEAWSSRASRVDNAVPVLYDDKLWLLGGKRNDSCCSKVYAHRPGVDGDAGWATMPDLPVAITEVAACVHDGALYVLGGRNDDGESSKSVFKLVKGGWKECRPLPFAMRSAVAQSLPDGRIALASKDGACVYDPQGKNTKTAVEEWNAGPAISASADVGDVVSGAWAEAVIEVHKGGRIRAVEIALDITAVDLDSLEVSLATPDLPEITLCEPGSGNVVKSGKGKALVKLSEDVLEQIRGSSAAGEWRLGVRTDGDKQGTLRAWRLKVDTMADMEPHAIAFQAGGLFFDQLLIASHAPDGVQRLHTVHLGAVDAAAARAAGAHTVDTGNLGLLAGGGLVYDADTATLALPGVDSRALLGEAKKGQASDAGPSVVATAARSSAKSASASAPIFDPAKANKHRLQLMEMSIAELRAKDAVTSGEATELLAVVAAAARESTLSPDVAQKVNDLFFESAMPEEAITAFASQWFGAGLAGITQQALQREIQRVLADPPPDDDDLRRLVAAARGLPNGDLSLLESPLGAALAPPQKHLLGESVLELFAARVAHLVNGGADVTKPQMDMARAIAVKLQQLVPDLKAAVDEQMKRLLLLAGHEAGAGDRLKPYFKKDVTLSPLEALFANRVFAGTAAPAKQAKAGAARSAAPALQPGEVLSAGSRYEPVQAEVKAISRVAKPATEADETLLLRLLDTLPQRLLVALKNAGYTITVARHFLANAAKEEAGKVLLTPAGPIHIDLGEGLHTHGGNAKPHITVRTYLKDGALQLDAATLIHELGHAIDFVLCAVAEDKPLHLDGALADAFKKEHPRLHSYFHSQEEFTAEVIAYYLLDPERCQRQFPETFKALDNMIADLRPDIPAITAVQQELCTPAVVHLAAGTNDPRKELVFRELLNRARRDEGLPTQPYIIGLATTDRDLGAAELATELAETMRSQRTDAARYRSGESLLQLDAATFNNASELQKILQEQVLVGRGALIYLDDLASIQTSSAGFKVLKAHMERFGGLNPLVLTGEPSEVKRLKDALLPVDYCPYELQALEPEEQAELIARMARDESFVLEPAALEALTKIARGGGYQATKALWRQVKEAQVQRLAKSGAPRGAVTAAAANQVLVADVASVKPPKERLPLEEMQRLIGQEPAKRELNNVIGQVKLAEKKREAGLDDTRPRLNLLFAGDPGTGKTTFAELFVEELHRIGYLKNKKVKTVRVQDLVASSNPEDAVKRLFEQNKGGAVFIDEMHQLKDTAEGKRAFRAMIPYLGHKEYADTVFIGAGYTDELRDLIRDVDPGGERRFATVPFESFNGAELGSILDKMVADRGLMLSADATKAALARLDAERRQMKHFGNAGTVQSVLENAQKKQTQRLAAADLSALSRDELVQLTPEDFAAEVTITRDQIWAEIDALEGLDQVKEKLREIAALVEFAAETNDDPFKYIEPYFILEGPPGSGKTTVARLLARFGVAYGLIPSAEVIEKQGASVQGKYVGSWTSDEVAKTCESAWGRLLFLDEIGGLARTAGDFKSDAAKAFLKQMEDYRGKFLMVIADYPDGINDFLALDAGLARRFGNRLSCAPMTADQAYRSLAKLLAESQFDASKVEGVLLQHLGVIVNEPGWASGGDVRKLKNLIVQKQARAFVDGRARGVQAKVLEPEAVASAVAELRREKAARAAGGSRDTQKKDDLTYAYATKAAQKSDAKEEEAVKPLDASEHKLLAIVAQVDKEFSAIFNTNPAEQARQETDVNSAYIKRIAEKLGEKPAVVIERLQKVKVKVTKLVTSQKLVEHFQYHCPYCGGVESPSCAYINYPLEWKVQHSLKKPWTEAVNETKQVEEEQEVDKVTTQTV